VTSTGYGLCLARSRYGIAAPHMHPSASKSMHLYDADLDLGLDVSTARSGAID